jgi:hypothetical protein
MEEMKGQKGKKGKQGWMDNACLGAFITVKDAINTGIKKTSGIKWMGLDQKASSLPVYPLIIPVHPMEEGDMQMDGEEGML